MSLNSDSKKLNNSKIDLTNPPFRAYFLKIFGNSGILSYQLKIVLLVSGVFIIDIVHAYWMNVLSYYLIDHIRHIILLLLPITFILFIHVCNQVDVTLEVLNKIFKKPTI